MQDGAQVYQLHPQKARKAGLYFTRDELALILGTYGRGVASGQWRDYAIDMGRETASFAIYRRASEAPLYSIVKDPSLRQKQGLWRLVATDGKVLKRGHDLRSVLARLQP